MPRALIPHLKRSASSYDVVCRMCAVIRRAEYGAELDAVVALSIAAEMELDDLPGPVQKHAVTGFLRLDEVDALELLRQLPPETHLADDRHEQCPLVGTCEYRWLVLHYLAPPFEHI